MGKTSDPFQKITKTKRAGVMAEGVEHLSGKHEALNSNFSFIYIYIGIYTYIPIYIYIYTYMYV
jgi:hypothetical protein